MGVYDGWRQDLTAGRATLMVSASTAKVAALSAQARRDRIAGGDPFPRRIQSVHIPSRQQALATRQGAKAAYPNGLHRIQSAASPQPVRSQSARFSQGTRLGRRCPPVYLQVTTRSPLHPTTTVTAGGVLDQSLESLIVCAREAS